MTQTDIQIDRQIIVRDRLQTKIEHKDRQTDKMKVDEQY